MTYSFVCRENVAESAVRRGPHKKISAWTQFKFSIAMVCTVTEKLCDLNERFGFPTGEPLLSGI